MEYMARTQSVTPAGIEPGTFGKAVMSLTTTPLGRQIDKKINKSHRKRRSLLHEFTDHFYRIHF